MTDKQLEEVGIIKINSYGRYYVKEFDIEIILPRGFDLPFLLNAIYQSGYNNGKVFGRVELQENIKELLSINKE